MCSDLFSKPADLSGLYARVALERGIDYPEGLTYALPASLLDARVGERVRAPLGRGDRPVEGYIIQIAPDLASLGAGGLDPRRVKLILDRAGRPAGARRGAGKEVGGGGGGGGGGGDVGRGVMRGGGVPVRLIELAQWISGYYCCPIGLTLASMTPAAVKRRTGSTIQRVFHRPSVTPSGAALESLAPTAASAWGRVAALEEGVFPIEPRALADLIGERSVAAVNRLVRAGLLRASEREVVKSRGAVMGFGGGDGLDQGGLGSAAGPELTRAQSEAVEGIAATLGSYRPHLLFGVTGSGKTEVYLRVLERVIDRGETGIVLVPEISLTPQTAGRFTDRFAARLLRSGVAVLHSGLTASQRHGEWARVAAGEARIVIGARSAVFAPLDGERGAKLGIIIVDEEHDSSYKQDQAPRYHARDVALRRGQLEGCPVILGTATPSLESWHNAAPARGGGGGRFVLHRLMERVGGGRLPRVDVVDLVEEQRRRGGGDRRLRSIGPTLEEAIRVVLDGDERRGRDTVGRPEPLGDGGRIMLLLNRRGYANYICCPDQSCGWFLTCRHCDVTAVYHRRELAGAGEGGRLVGVVRCHHCLAEQRLPAVCPTCGKKINTFGFGTQRLEEELASLFPSLASGRTMLRLDSDTMRRASDYFSALDRFRRGEVRLLLGTQMIAKGLDFPDVELIGVINADTAINLPDFRAAERTFALVSQVAGRAGRGEGSAGRARVIVQTMNPKEPAIVFAAGHDFEGFASRELELRREVGLPPIGRMARIVCRDEDAGKARMRAMEVFRALEEVGVEGVRVRAPAPCPISRIAGRHRWGVEVMAGSAGLIQRALAGVRRLASVRSDAHTAVDVDPVALL